MLANPLLLPEQRLSVAVDKTQAAAAFANQRMPFYQTLLASKFLSAKQGSPNSVWVNSLQNKKHQ